MLLEDISAKVGREDIFKLTVWDEVYMKLVMIMELSRVSFHLLSREHKAFIIQDYNFTRVSVLV
jgi:hypothetical protein